MVPDGHLQQAADQCYIEADTWIESLLYLGRIIPIFVWLDVCAEGNKPALRSILKKTPAGEGSQATYSKRMSNPAACLAPVPSSVLDCTALHVFNLAPSYPVVDAAQAHPPWQWSNACKQIWRAQVSQSGIASGNIHMACSVMPALHCRPDHSELVITRCALEEFRSNGGQPFQQLPQLYVVSNLKQHFRHACACTRPAAAVAIVGGQRG